MVGEKIEKPPPPLVAFKTELRDALKPDERDVDEQEHKEDCRHNGCMEDKKAADRTRIVRVAAEEHPFHVDTEDGDAIGDVGSHGSSPKAELFEDQAVAGKTENGRTLKDAHSYHPVDLPGLPIGSRKIDPDLVEDDGGDKEGRPPFVQTPDIPSVGNGIVDVFDRFVGRQGGGGVVEAQQDSRHYLDEKEEGRRSSEAEPPVLHVVGNRLVGEVANIIARDGDALTQPCF